MIYKKRSINHKRILRKS